MNGHQAPPTSNPERPIWSAARPEGDLGESSVDTLTIRQALDSVGLHAPARFYPAWACAEAFLLILLRAGERLPAGTIFRRADEVGLSEGAIRRAKIRLAVISTKQRGVRDGEWWWHLPRDLTTDVGLSRLGRPWWEWREPK